MLSNFHDFEPIHESLLSTRSVAQASLRIRISAHASYNTALRLTFMLSKQQALFCSTLALFYDKVKHQHRLHCISLISRQSLALFLNYSQISAILKDSIFF